MIRLLVHRRAPDSHQTKRLGSHFGEVPADGGTTVWEGIVVNKWFIRPELRASDVSQFAAVLEQVPQCLAVYVRGSSGVQAPQSKSSSSYRGRVDCGERGSLIHNTI